MKMQPLLSLPRREPFTGSIASSMAEEKWRRIYSKAYLDGCIHLIDKGGYMNETLKLLAIFPHPDDETLGLGSTFARYSSEGVETYLVCATRGERGWFE